MLSRIFRDQRGITALATGLSLVALAGFVGLAVDVSSWLTAQRKMQDAVDQAAYGAVTGVTASQSGYTNALALLSQSGYGCHSVGSPGGSGSLTCNGSGGVSVAVNSPPQHGSYTGDNTAWEVVLTQPQPSHFARLFLPSAPTISARAVGLQGGNVCILALDTRTNDIHSIFGGNSAVVTVAGNCQVADNLLNNSDTDDVDVKSGASLTFNSLYMRDASKCDSGSCQGTLNVTQYLYNQKAIVNPYAARTIPPASGTCNYTNLVVSTTQTLSPGTYCGTGGNAALTISTPLVSLSLKPPAPPPTGTTVLTFTSTTGVTVGMAVSDTTTPAAIPAGTTVRSLTANAVTVSAVALGGPTGLAPNDTIQFSPAGGNITVTLSPGIYILDGQGGGTCTGTTKPTTCLSGDLILNNGATVTGSGVTIDLTTSKSVGIDIGNVYIENNSGLSITAPTTNLSGFQTSGMALWQDSRAPNPSQTDGNQYTSTSDGVNTVLAGATTNITGLIYFPSQGLLYTGGNGGSACTQIVAFSIVFQFSAQFNYPNNCAAAAAELPIGATVKLAE